MLNVCGMLANISNLYCQSRLMIVALVYLLENQLSSATVPRDVSSTYEIVRNDEQFDKFKNLTVFYNKQFLNV